MDSPSANSAAATLTCTSMSFESASDTGSIAGYSSCSAKATSAAESLRARMAISFSIAAFARFTVDSAVAASAFSSAESWCCV
jgi:hypothetical protein